MHPPSHSIDQVMIVGLVSGAIFAILAWRSSGLVARVVLWLIALGLLVPTAILYVGRNPWLVDARSRTFVTLYWNIRIGMSREEVLGEIRNLYPPGQTAEAPSLAAESETTLEIHMTPVTPTETAEEAILLKIQGGQVVGKDYQAK